MIWSVRTRRRTPSSIHLHRHRRVLSGFDNLLKLPASRGWRFELGRDRRQRFEDGRAAVLRSPNIRAARQHRPTGSSPHDSHSMTGGRNQFLQLLQLLAPLCIQFNSKAEIGKAKMDTFDDEQLLIIGNLEDDDDRYTYARILGRLPISELGVSTLIADFKKIESDKATAPTTKQELKNARVGQGKFGSDVRTFWNHRCSITGASTKAALEASYIKRWADSNNAQRLDPNNGLLLTANLHKLFDAGLISFDDSGQMLVSSKLSQSEQEIFGVIGKKLSKKPSVETANYLSYHRTKFLE